jgi:hypothetical protein
VQDAEGSSAEEGSSPPSTPEARTGGSAPPPEAQQQPADGHDQRSDIPSASEPHSDAAQPRDPGQASPDPRREQPGGPRDPEAADGRATQAGETEREAAGGEQASSQKDTANDEERAFAEQAERQARLSGLRGLFGQPAAEERPGSAATLGPSSPAAGRDANVNYIYYEYGTRVAPDPGPLDEAWVEERADAVPTASFDQLADQLKRRRAQVLTGPEGSGRLTAAVSVLARFAGTKRLNALRPGVEPYQLAAGDLAAGHGYVLDAAGADWARKISRGLLGNLDKLLSEAGAQPQAAQPSSQQAAGAWLVLLVGDDIPLDWSTLEGFAVRHQPPPAEAVLRGRLRAKLEKELWPGVDEFLDHGTIRTELRGTTHPWQVAELAGRLLEIWPDEGTLDPDDPRLAKTLRSRRLQKVKEELQNGDGGLRSRSILVAAAVLDGFPLVQLTAAADLLARYLHAVEEPDTRRGRPVFEATVSECEEFLQIHPSDDTTEAEPDRDEATDSDHGSDADGDESGQNSSTARPRADGLPRWLWPGGERTRRVWLNDPAWQGTVLEVLWHWHDGARQPLLDWLVTLATGADELERVRAAQAIGKLATLDFDHLHQQILRYWAASERGSERQAAARALEVVALEGRLAPDVRRLARRWCESRDALRRRSGALTWGTMAGYLFPDDALHDLAELAREPEHLYWWELPHSVAELVRAGRVGEALGALVDWAKCPDAPVRAQAARCLVWLSWFDAPAPATAWPGLLWLATDRPEALRRRDGTETPPQQHVQATAREPVEGRWDGSSARRLGLLAELWQPALSYGISASAAWKSLLHWAERGDSDPELLEPLGVLLSDLIQNPHLRRRLRFHVLRWQLKQRHPTPASEFVLNLVEKG